MENATYTWTKNLSAFFVVLAFWLVHFLYKRKIFLRL